MRYDSIMFGWDQAAGATALVLLGVTLVGHLRKRKPTVAQSTLPYVPIFLDAGLEPRSLPKELMAAVAAGLLAVLGQKMKRYIKVRNNTEGQIFVKVERQDLFTEKIKEATEKQLSVKPTQAEVAAAVKRAVENVLVERKVTSWRTMKAATSGAKRQSQTFLAGFTSSARAYVTVVNADTNEVFCIAEPVAAGDKLVITPGTMTMEQVQKLVFGEGPETGVIAGANPQHNAAGEGAANGGEGVAKP